MSTRLIINADDLGVNSQRSHGIFQCFEFGVVTNASIVANGSDSDAAAKHARERGLPAGLHLNLTEEYPLSKQSDIASLVEMNGQFFDRKRFNELLDEGKIEKTALERELRAQVEWMFDTYGAPTHIDGHQQIQVHPRIIEVLIPIMQRYGIRFIRIPAESLLPPFGYEIPEDRLKQLLTHRERANAARVSCAAEGILSTDDFRGLALHGYASLKNLRHTINRLGDGVTELQVHPGSPIAYGTPFDTDPQRQTELRMLLDESIPALLAEKKIELVSWADL